MSEVLLASFLLFLFSLIAKRASTASENSPHLKAFIAIKKKLLDPIVRISGKVYPYSPFQTTINQIMLNDSYLNEIIRNEFVANDLKL